MISPSDIFCDNFCSTLPLTITTFSCVSAQLLRSFPKSLFKSQPGLARPQLQTPACWSLNSQYALFCKIGVEDRAAPVPHNREPFFTTTASCPVIKLDVFLDTHSVHGPWILVEFKNFSWQGFLQLETTFGYILILIKQVQNLNFFKSLSCSR